MWFLRLPSILSSAMWDLGLGSLTGGVFKIGQRYGYRQILDKSSRYSPSSSNESSAFSTDGSSADSRRSHSRSPARPRTCRPSLQYHMNMMASPIEGHSQDVKVHGGRQEALESSKILNVPRVRS